MKNYQVLLYYQYVAIDKLEEFAKVHLAFCKSLNLKGRILVATEGINGTLSGLTADTETYMATMHTDPRFKEMVFKVDEAEENVFKKMHVRPRKEIVSLDLADDVDPLTLTGEYLSPKEFKSALEDGNTVVIDARNYYEFDLGHFRGAIRPDIRNFRELPQWIRENKEKFMKKRVVTYCTGGIRCEKFSGWLVREGFQDVGQLDGGIATYSRDTEVLGELWDGKMYVFDERLSVPINQVNPVVIAKDWFDGQPCERYVNCSNPFCNRQMIASRNNEEKYLRGCSPECRAHEDNRYVDEHNLTNAKWEAKLIEIGETLGLQEPMS